MKSSRAILALSFLLSLATSCFADDPSPSLSRHLPPNYQDAIEQMLFSEDPSCSAISATFYDPITVGLRHRSHQGSGGLAYCGVRVDWAPLDQKGTPTGPIRQDVFVAFQGKISRVPLSEIVWCDGAPKKGTEKHLRLSQSSAAKSPASSPS